MLPLLLIAAAAAAQTAPPVQVDPKAVGAWYRKIASVDTVEFDGIAARGVLPRPSFDPARMHAPGPGEKEWAGGPLDSPGVNIGARADGIAVDAGLKWDHRYDEQGRDTGLYAWRVFWRVTTPAGSVWRDPEPGSPQDLYLDPGARFAMSLTVRPDGTARLDVRGDGPGAGSTYATFPAPGFWDDDGVARLPRRFKRVHSIDQFVEGPDGARHGNEGAPALPTRATLTDGRWDSAELTGTRTAPLAGALAVDWRGADEAASYAAVFPTAGLDGSGGEPIEIRPPRP